MSSDLDKPLGTLYFNNTIFYDFLLFFKHFFLLLLQNK